jgi:hypothetical protein
MAEDIPSQPFGYEGLDLSPASKSAIEEVSDAIRGDASRVGDAIEKGKTRHAAEHPQQHCAGSATRLAVGRVLARCCCGPASLKQQYTEPGLS